MTTPAADFTIYIVEDDASVRDALGLLLGLRGYRTAIFADAESFLQAWRADWHGCLLLDIRMPGMDGLTLQRRLLDLGCRLPAIVMSGHGDVGSARDAFKSQAVDFLEKPLDHGRLLAAIEEAGQRLTATQREQAHDARRDAFAERLAALTPREREVMEMVVAGRHNREIAEALGISARTVEVHKARMMQKLRVDGLPQLIRLSLGHTDEAR
ncbi:MAG: DNA-binding response regulator [Candidatus Accumulibacter sp. 66-26]|nr:response regulator transcription factor [Accumulibacter sp.]OJW46782.1 MAG: DNA-binding response regulator [Candidatus Accumulibacter sp. 66-26]